MKKRVLTAITALCAMVSLSACDALMDGGCHIDSEYQISCPTGDGPELHEPNS